MVGTASTWTTGSRGRWGCLSPRTSPAATTPSFRCRIQCDSRMLVRLGGCALGAVFGTAQSIDQSVVIGENVFHLAIVSDEE
eukprot:9502618-Pyramimonas_sp.AAC.2